MSSEMDEGATGESVGGIEPSQRVVVDWLVTAFLLLVGLASAALGYLAFDNADRDWIADAVRDESFQSDVFTEEELIDLFVESLTWGGYALIAIGLGMMAVGIGYIILRRRDHHRSRETGVVESGLLADGIVGAIVTLLTSFIPFSGIIGGGLAGYLYGGSRLDGAKAGGMSGVMLTLPLVVGLIVLSIGFVSVDMGWLAAVGALVVGFSAVFSIGLGALGGYLGVYLAERNVD